MQKRTIPLVAACLLCLWGLGPAQAAGDVVPDLDKVHGMEHFVGDEAARALLKKNGFVVLSRYYHRIFSPYIDSKLPPYITADSVHRTFHVIFEDLLKEMETGFAPEVRDLCRKVADGVAVLPEAEKHPEAAELVRLFFIVGDILIAGGEVPGGTDARVSAEVKLARGAARVALSPLFGYEIDYTQFKPRSFYTATPVLRRYFQAMSWYGDAAFRQISDLETRAAMLIALVFARDPELLDRWKEIDRVYSHFIFPCDDLTPEEYAQVAASMDAARIAGDPFKWFKSRVAELRDPKINSMVLSPSQMHDWVAPSKCMRVLGKRYIPDSEVFMELTDPKVPGRGFPTGLDLMAANGSARAREQIVASGDANLPGYAKGAERAAALLDELKSAEQTTHYSELLQLAESLTMRPDERAAAFAKTEAYADKSLTTALAMWVSTRHAWQLHAKQSVTIGCAVDLYSSGYIEPNPAFFQAMQRLIWTTLKIIKNHEHIQTGRLEILGELVAELLRLNEKILASEPFAILDQAWFTGYGGTIQALQAPNEHTTVDMEQWMGLVADVHTTRVPETGTNKCLEIATSGAMPIYSAVLRNGRWQLYLGGVYSYHEFQRKIESGRLTDEEWHRMLHDGLIPPLPAWTVSYVGGYKYEIEMEGPVPANDSEFDSNLQEVIADGELLEKNGDFYRILQLAANRLGRKVAPRLLEILRTGALSDQIEQRGRDAIWGRYKLGLAEAAGLALASIVSEEDVPALTEIALGPTAERAVLAVEVASEMQEMSVETFLLTVAKEGRSLRVRRLAIQRLGSMASKDVTGELVALWPLLDAELKAVFLYALEEIWLDEPGTLSPAYDRDIKAWEEEITKLLAGIVKNNSQYQELALKLAGKLGLSSLTQTPDEATSTLNSCIETRRPSLETEADDAFDTCVEVAERDTRIVGWMDQWITICAFAMLLVAIAASILYLMKWRAGGRRQ